MSGRDGRLNPKPNLTRRMDGPAIGDLLRDWERQHGRDLSERRWEAAFLAAERAVDDEGGYAVPFDRQRRAAMGAIHAALTPPVKVRH